MTLQLRQTWHTNAATQFAHRETRRSVLQQFVCYCMFQLCTNTLTSSFLLCKYSREVFFSSADACRVFMTNWELSITGTVHSKETTDRLAPLSLSRMLNLWYRNRNIYFFHSAILGKELLKTETCEWVVSQL